MGNSLLHAIVTSFDTQDDRVLIYIDTYPNNDYHVIAPKGFEPIVGDQISYEPYGFNFGWLKEVIRTNNLPAWQAPQNPLIFFNERTVYSSDNSTKAIIPKATRKDGEDIRGPIPDTDFEKGRQEALKMMSDDIAKQILFLESLIGKTEGVAVSQDYITGSIINLRHFLWKVNHLKDKNRPNRLYAGNQRKI